MSDVNYILGQVIARGGMAEIYRGLHIGQDGFRRLVAIKRILPQYSTNSEFADMFRDEAHIGQRLQHANIVKVECFSIIDQCPSIVMEFVDGSDLRSLLAETERSKSAQRVPIAMARSTRTPAGAFGLGDGRMVGWAGCCAPYRPKSRSSGRYMTGQTPMRARLAMALGWNG